LGWANWVHIDEMVKETTSLLGEEMPHSSGGFTRHKSIIMFVVFIFVIIYAFIIRRPDSGLENGDNNPYNSNLMGAGGIVGGDRDSHGKG